MVRPSLCSMMIVGLLAGIALPHTTAAEGYQTDRHVCPSRPSDNHVRHQAFPATGQMTCWDSNGDVVDCEDTGHDGDVQAGAPLRYRDNGLTITDKNTKLTWQKQDDNNAGNCDVDDVPDNLDQDCVFTWDDAFLFVDALNANCFGGYKDWRVPNIKELQSIVNYENDRPAVSTAFNDDDACDDPGGCTLPDCSCTASSFYWSSTSFASPPVPDGFAWGVSFINGSVFGGNKDNDAPVRAVRGGLKLDY